MKAARIHSFGPPDVVVVEDIPVPSPGTGEVLVRVMASGVAPWDAIIREGKSRVSPQPAPHAICPATRLTGSSDPYSFFSTSRFGLK